MIIDNKKTKARRGRPSVSSCTFRRSDYHITFSTKTAKDLNLCLGVMIDVISNKKDMYLCINENKGFRLFGYKNGLKHISFAITAKHIVLSILDSINAQKAASFIIAAKSEMINGCKCYKIINTPLRVD